MICIEGMGVIGSLLAYELEARGMDFVWYDNERSINAWSASTGAIYPSATKSYDAYCYQEWWNWNYTNRFPNDVLQMCRWFFNQKSNPFSFKGKIQKVGCLNEGVMPCFNVNVQKLVADARKRFGLQRIGSIELFSHYCKSEESVHVVAHGFTERLDHYFWGWSAQARVEFRGDLAGLTPSECSAFFRHNRFQFDYLYRIPGTEFHYLGSCLQRQVNPTIRLRESIINDYVIPSAKRVHNVTDNQVKIVSFGQVLQGFRPAPANDEEPWVIERNGKLMIRPLWNSGLRHFPELLKHLMKELQ